MRWTLLPVFAAALTAQQATLEHAWDLVAKGDRDQAVKVLQAIVRSHPGDGEARLLLGSILTEQGDREGAIGHLSEAVRLQPRSAEAQNALGEAYKTFGDMPSARVPFEKAVALGPDFAQARVNLGLALLEAGEFSAARPHLDKAIALLGGSTDAAFAHYLRAKVHTDNGEVSRALADLMRAVELTPDFPEAWSDLGQAHKALLNDIEAFSAFRRSVELEPDSPVARYRLGAEYLRRNQAAQAVEHLERSVQLNPNDQSALNSLQLALRRNGQADKAAEVKRRLTELLRARDEKSERALAAVRVNNEGAEREKAGSVAAALEKYREAFRLDPEHVGIRVNLAAALLRLGRWEEGITELRQAIQRDPSNQTLQGALRDALAQAPPEVLKRKP
jgi:protein O-GlcNAc transferase